MKGKILVIGSVAVGVFLIVTSFSSVVDAQATKGIQKFQVVQLVKEKINLDGNETFLWKMVLISIITILLLYKFRILGALFLFVANLDAGNLVEYLYFLFGILTGNIYPMVPPEPTE